MDEGRIEYGELVVGSMSPFHALQYVRTEVRKFLIGKTERLRVGVRVVNDRGDSEDWEFGPSIGYPTVNGETRNWMTDWLADY